MKANNTELFERMPASYSNNQDGFNFIYPILETNQCENDKFVTKNRSFQSQTITSSIASKEVPNAKIIDLSMLNDSS